MEKVLNVKKLCFKYETEEEKIFPSEYVELFKPIMREVIIIWDFSFVVSL